MDQKPPLRHWIFNCEGVNTQIFLNAPSRTIIVDIKFRGSPSKIKAEMLHSIIMELFIKTGSSYMSFDLSNSRLRTNFTLRKHEASAGAEGIQRLFDTALPTFQEIERRSKEKGFTKTLQQMRKEFNIEEEHRTPMPPARGVQKEPTYEEPVYNVSRVQTATLRERVHEALVLISMVTGIEVDDKTINLVTHTIERGFPAAPPTDTTGTWHVSRQLSVKDRVCEGLKPLNLANNEMAVIIMMRQVMPILENSPGR